MPANPNKTRCQQPNCRAWAVRGSDPPLCSAHAGRSLGAGAPPGNQNARTHGFYASAITRDELADILTHAADTTLDSEIAITRIALRRRRCVLRRLHSCSSPAPPPAPRPDPPPPFLAQVLDELSVEWGVKL